MKLRYNSLRKAHNIDIQRFFAPSLKGETLNISIFNISL